MPQECANCSQCHKFGLPIVLTRYAVALKYNEELVELDSHNPEMVKKDPDSQGRYGKGIHTLSGNFEVTDKEGGSSPQLDGGTQYTLRLLRSGFVYVYNEKDMVDKLRCYEVSENGLLMETTPSTPPCGCRDERRDIACAPEKNLMTAGILTIRNADKVGEVWIAYSDTKWTPAVAKLHEDRKYRKRHMRLVDVPKWMGGDYKHKHAANIHELDPKEAIIAEYAGVRSSAFSFSLAKFNQKEHGFNLARAAEELNKNATDGDKLFSSPPTDEEIPALQERWKSDKKVTILQRVGAMATAFERLIEEFNRFYDRAHSGVQQNTKYKNKGMILALDDPAGIAQDLNGLMIERQKNFGQSTKDRRPLTINANIERIHTQVVGSITREMANKFLGKESQGGWHRSQIVQERYQAMLEGEIDPEDFQKIYKEEWTDKYESKLDPNARKNFEKDFASRFGAYRGKFVTTLAQAHATWMESDRMFQYFDCNFDTGENAAQDKNKSSGISAQELEASEQSAAFAEIFSRCVGRTDEHLPCRNLYVKWLSEAHQDEKNLLWRAISLNQKKFSDDVKTANTKLEEIRSKLAARVGSAGGSGNADFMQGEKGSEIDELLRIWAFAWWDIHAEAQEKLHAAFSSDATAKTAIAALQTSRMKLQEVQQEIKVLSAKSSAQTKAAFEGATEAARIALSKERSVLNQKIRDAASQINRVAHSNSVGGLIDQLKGALLEAGQKANPNFKNVDALLSLYNGTPRVDLWVKGAGHEVGAIVGSRLAKNPRAGVFGKVMSALSGRPQTASARIPSTIDLMLLLESMMLDSKTPHFRAVYAKLISGIFALDALDVRGAAATIWNINKKFFNDIVELQGMRAKEANYADQYKQKMSSAKNSLEASRQTQQARNELTHVEQDLKAQQKMLSDKLETLDYDARRQSPAERRQAGMKHGWPIINGVIAGWCFWSLKKNLEGIGPSLGAEDKEYKHAVAAFWAGGLVVAGAGVELAHAGGNALLSAPVVRNWKWAAGLKNSEKAARVAKGFGTVMSSGASFIFASLDLKERQEALDRGQEGLAAAYLVSAILGGVSGAASFAALLWPTLVILGLPIGWIAVGCVILYAVVSTIISLVRPNETQQWLEGCVFGRNTDKRYTNSNWEIYEMGDFKRLGIAQ